MPCPLIFPLESFPLESFWMSQFMKPVSACLGIFFFMIGACVSRRLLKVLMTEKTGSFVLASNEVGIQDIHSKV